MTSSFDGDGYVPRTVFGKWLVLLCSVFTFGSGTGIPSSLSVMFLDWQDTFMVTRAHTAIVHSTCFSIVLGGAVLAGYVMNRIGARWTILFGSILASSGLFLSAFATSVNFLIITVGILSGFGFCFVQLPVIPCVTSVFATYKTVVISLCVVTTALIGIVNRYLLRYLIDQYSWRGACIIVAGMTLNTCVSGMIVTSIVRPFKDPLLTTDYEKTIVASDEAVDSSSNSQCVYSAGDTNPEAVDASSNSQCVYSAGDTNPETVDASSNSQCVYSAGDTNPEAVDASRSSQCVYSAGDTNPEAVDASRSSQCVYSAGDRNTDPKIHFHKDQSDEHGDVFQIKTSTSELNEFPPLCDNSGSSQGEHFSDNTSMLSRNQKSNSGNNINSIIKHFTSDDDVSIVSSNKCDFAKWRFLIDPMFALLLVHIGLCVASLYSFCLILMDFSRTLGFDESNGVLFLTVVFASSIFGRLGIGIGDIFPRIHSFVIQMFMAVPGALALLILSVVTDFLIVITLLAVIGVSVGGLVAIYPKCALDVKSVDRRTYPIALGFFQTVEGLMSLIIAVAIGLSVDVTGSYTFILIVMGCASLVSTFMLGMGYFVTSKPSHQPPLPPD